MLIDKGELVATNGARIGAEQIEANLARVYTGMEKFSPASLMTEAARQLGLHRSNLYRKMRQLGMESPE